MVDAITKYKKEHNKRATLSKNILDRFDYKCFYCNIDVRCENIDIEKHHYIPEVFGGTTSKNNLVLTCYDCHKKLHKHISGDYCNVRFRLYLTLCKIFKIIPIMDGFDDDLYYDKEDNTYNKIKVLMRYYDFTIGGILNNFKMKELLCLFDDDKEFIKRIEISEKIKEILEKNPFEVAKRENDTII